MALPLSGPISIDLVSDEFGGTIPDIITEYYRNAGLVTANNLTVPESGLIDLEDFYGTEKIDAVVISSNTLNLVISDYFTQAQWADTSIKRLTIATGVSVGSNSVSVVACRTGTTISGSPLNGTLELIIDGYIYGAGGAAGNGGPGGIGGNALEAEIPVTVYNNSRIWAGGGGGGAGGRGGDTYTKSYVYGTAWLRDTNNTLFTFGPGHPQRGQAAIKWGGVNIDCQIGYTSPNVGGWSNPHFSPTVQTRLFSCRNDIANDDTWYEFIIDPADGWIQQNYIRKFLAVSQIASVTPGGAGQGYNQAQTNGTAGTTGVPVDFSNSPYLWSDPNDNIAPFNTAPGQLIATTDGSGGNGGGWGASGGNGGSGTSGRYTSGRTGYSGGLAGYYIVGNSSVTWAVTGDRRGRVT